ncbi:MAG: HEAT repeat domain-containing protein [Cyanobacteria bacterium J06639_1]
METIDALVEQLQSQKIGERFRASRALVRYKAEASPAIPYLIEALADDSTIVRDSVVWALSAIEEDALPALEQAACDRDFPHRMLAIYALGRYTNNAPARVN